MKNKKKNSPTYHFHGTVGQVIDHIENQYVTFDKNMEISFAQGLLNTEASKREVIPSHASETKESTLEKTLQKSDLDAMRNKLFKEKEGDCEGKEQILSILLKNATTKSKACRKLYEYRANFNLDNLSGRDKARVINAWVEHLQIKNFKTAFTDKDFAAYYTR